MGRNSYHIMYNNEVLNINLLKYNLEIIERYVPLKARKNKFILCKYF